MSLKIIRDDISKVKADVIVNSANKEPICGGGAEYHIYETAGYNDLLKAREQVGPLQVAEIAVTPAFALNAKYIIHTVGPKWNDGDSGEALALTNCYRRALEKAKELGCNSIAFPLISSGVFRFPKDNALKIALHAISEFLQANEMSVTLVVFDRKAFEISEELSNDIQAFIDDNYVQEKYKNIPSFNRCYPQRSATLTQDNSIHEYFSLAEERSHKEPGSKTICHASAKESQSLDDILAKPIETFCDKLFSLIHEKKMNDVEIYKRANLDRKHFSKIRSNINYKPTKKTAIALAIALHLNLDETNDLLARAGFALSPSNKGDLIVTYFIEQQKYDIWEINSTLFKFEQPTLGI